ncbi:MAG TPA: hypothetical protein VNV60_02925 [Holophagaceae bacterium]|nr:hypothetical protein [Holophagaceae bacterium]
MTDAEALCRSEATRRRVAFVSLEGGQLSLEVREPADALARALAAKGWQAGASGPYTLRVSATDWLIFWAEAGPLLDCGC